MSNAITVLIADDHPVVRQGLAVLLEVQDDITLVGQAADGGEAVSMAEAHNPDVRLLDLKLPVLDGLGGCWLSCARAALGPRRWC